MPVIPATREAEAEGLKIQGQPSKVKQDPISKEKEKETGSVA
jgi:hypothetical protein